MMMRLLSVLSIFVLYGCDYYLINPHTHQVGYIPQKWFDSEDFEPCFPEKIFPYNIGRNSARFRPGKDSLRRYFATNYDHKGIINESGYITIRFMINCNGVTGRFEILEVGLDYREKSFNKVLSNHLMELTASLKDWHPLELGEPAYDSFIHITYKIDNGDLVEILP